MEKYRGKNPFKETPITDVMETEGMSFVNGAFRLLYKRSHLRRETTGEKLHPGIVAAQRDVLGPNGEIITINCLGRPDRDNLTQISRRDTVVISKID